MTTSMHLVYFKVEWDFMNNLTLSSGNHIPQDAPVKKKVPKSNKFGEEYTLYHSLWEVTMHSTTLKGPRSLAWKKRNQKLYLTQNSPNLNLT